MEGLVAAVGGLVVAAEGLVAVADGLAASPEVLVAAADDWFVAKCLSAAQEVDAPLGELIEELIPAADELVAVPEKLPPPMGELIDKSVRWR